MSAPVCVCGGGGVPCGGKHIIITRKVSVLYAASNAALKPTLGALETVDLAFTRHCHNQQCMVYGLLKGGRRKGHIVCNVGAILLQ